MVSRENKQWQRTSRPRKRESALEIRGFEGGLDRPRKEIAASPAGVRKSGALLTRPTLSRAEDTQLMPDVAANGLSGSVTSATVPAHILHPDEAGMPGVAAPREDESSSDGRALHDGGRKAFETTGAGSSLEPMPSLLGSRQNKSEEAAKEVGGTAVNRQSGLFPSTLTARDSSRSDNGKQRGEVSETDHLHRNAADKLARGTVSPIQGSGSRESRHKGFVGRPKADPVGSTGDESSSTVPAGDVAREHTVVKGRVRQPVMKGESVRAVNRIVAARKEGIGNKSMTEKGGPTVVSGKRLPSGVTPEPPGAVTTGENDGKEDDVRQHPTFCSTVSPLGSTSVPVVKRIGEALPRASVSVGSVTRGRAVRFHSSGASRDAANHAVVRPTVTTTPKRHASAATLPTTTPTEFTQTQSGGAGFTQGARTTPPEVRFARDNQRLYKSGNDGGKRGRGKRGVGFGGGAKRKFSTAPAPAKGAVLGGWRTERQGQGKRARVW